MRGPGTKGKRDAEVGLVRALYELQRGEVVAAWLHAVLAVFELGQELKPQEWERVKEALRSGS